MSIELKSRPAKILFVDDEIEILNALKRQTRGLDEETFFFSDPNEAVEFVYSQNIDIIVSDLKMPSMDGVTLLSNIAERCPETIRILLTGNANADVVISAVNKGRIWGFIEKPWQGAQLIALLKQAVQTKQLIQTRSNQLYKELEQAKVMADAGLNAKNEFLAVMSHEIRTPMTAILGSLELLADTSIGPKQDNLVNNALGAGKALLSVVNNVLDYSKIEAGKLSLNSNKFSILSSIDYLHDIFIDTAKAKKISLMFCLSPSISEQFMLDEQRLNQVLINLIGNAIKFTDSGGVELSIHSDDKDLFFEVTDTGIGINKVDIEVLFDEFVQVDSSYQRQYEGTGLGLAISKQLVALMGGKLSVSSTVGKGSTFNFQLPHRYYDKALIDEKKLVKQKVSLINFDAFCERALTKQLQLWNCDVTLVKEKSLKQQLYIEGRNELPAKADKMRYLPPSVESIFVDNYQVLLNDIFGGSIKKVTSFDNEQVIETGNNESILVVEDSLPNQLVAQAMLENANYKVDIASNGIEAIEFVKSNSYRLVLMDLSMPKMDGAQACEILRSEGGRFADLPIWAMTANVAKRDIQHCMEAGMDDFIEKPINRKLLLTKIHSLLTAEYDEQSNNKVFDLDVINTLDSNIVKQLVKDTGIDVFSKILMLFIDETLQRVDRIEQAFKGRVYTEIKNEAHAIKSSSATIGAMKLNHLAIMLERDSNEGNQEKLEPIVAILLDTANAAISELKQYKEKRCV